MFSVLVGLLHATVLSNTRKKRQLTGSFIGLFLWGLLSRAVIIYPMSVLNAKVIEYILLSGIIFFWQFSLIWSFPNSRVCLKTVFLCVPTIDTICLKTWRSRHGFLKCSLTEIQSDYFLKLWVILHSEKLDVEKLVCLFVCLFVVCFFFFSWL